MQRGNKSNCKLFMTNLFKFIPVGLIGQIIGSILIIPLIYFLVNRFYFSNKYNNNVEHYVESYIGKSIQIKVYMPDYDSKVYMDNVDPEIKTIETFMVKADGNYFANPEARYIPFYSMEYKKYFIVMYFDCAKVYGYDKKEVYLTVNKDDMNNPEYGTRENPIPVLKMVGVNESIRDNDKDYDKAYMDSFYRQNVICYLKYKMPKGEFKRRFKNK